jgi:hypothetical protein
MMRHSRFLALALLAGLTVAGTARADKPVEHFTAFAVDMSNTAGRTRAGTVDIIINRWSTPEERDRLVASLREGGNDGLLRSLQKIKEPAGYIRRAGSIGYPLRFAWQVPSGDGRRVIVATDRPVSFLEARNHPRTMDYPFMLIEIRMDAQGKGQGKLIPLAKVQLNDEHVVEIENYSSEPVRLSEVREVK